MFYNQTLNDRSNTKVKGNNGESIACTFLEGKGFRIIARNYLRKWGEIDIIAEKDGVPHFFEVKSVTADFSASVNGHRPEDNVHGLKVRHIRRMIETYLEEEGRGLDCEFQFHVLCVFMDMRTRKARVQWMENIIL